VRDTTGTRAASAGVLICYESLFPALAADLAADGADVLVNVANYGWFAETPLLEQALAHAAFRAAENGRPFLLASNNGISAWFDARGRLRERTEADREAVPIFSLPLPAPERTLFTRTGETPAAVLGGAAVLFVVLSGRRRRKVSPKSGETS
jgi:apolipoprotein N-acyltransferase